VYFSHFAQCTSHSVTIYFDRNGPDWCDRSVRRSYRYGGVRSDHEGRRLAKAVRRLLYGGEGGRFVGP
jgi:hypothetical protein